MRTKNNRNPRKVSPRRARRARQFKGRQLERINNKAALTFEGRIVRHPLAPQVSAPMIAAQVLRSTARRYMIQPGTDEHELLKTVLAERAEKYR
jgi:hypothetical protein